MAKYIKTYHDGLTADAVEVMTVYRLTVTYAFLHPDFHGEIHQHYFENEGGLLYTYVIDALSDMKYIDSIKIDKL